MSAFRPSSANAPWPPSDRAVVRQEHRGDFRLYQAYYSEKIVLLNSYQPKDNKRQSRASKALGPRIRSTTRRISWMSSKTRSEEAVADPRGERDAKPSSIGD